MEQNSGGSSGKKETAALHCKIECRVCPCIASPAVVDCLFSVL